MEGAPLLRDPSHFANLTAARAERCHALEAVLSSNPRYILAHNLRSAAGERTPVPQPAFRAKRRDLLYLRFLMVTGASISTTASSGLRRVRS